MFLQKYVQEVDEQLARLMAARDKIATLAGPAPEYKTEFSYQAPLAPVASPELSDSEQKTELKPSASEAVVPAVTEIVAAPAKRRGRPKGSRNKTTMIRTRRMATPEPRALASIVPTGPVVVSPAQLAKRHEVVVVKPQTPAPKPEVSSPASNVSAGGGLDALIRELSERRATAFSPAA